MGSGESALLFRNTCFYLPLFFNRREEAERNLRRIVSLLPEKNHVENPPLMLHILNFIVENIVLEEEELNMAALYAAKIRAL